MKRPKKGKSLAQIEGSALQYRSRELEKYAEHARADDIRHNIIHPQRAINSLRELVTAMHICREYNPQIWTGFVSTRLERAMARAQAELRTDR